MFTRLRTTWLAGSGALVLVLSISGAALGASLLAAGPTPTAEEETDPIVVVDTSGTFEDVDGDSIDDDCDDAVVADPVAEASAEAAVDLDGDGELSVSEAAQSSRTGGSNCNHGGYVSQVAHDQCDGSAEEVDPAEELTDPAPTDEPPVIIEVGLEPNDEAEDESGDAPEAADCDAEDAEEAVTDEAEVEACEEVAAPTFDPAAFAGPGGFGRYVSTVAASDAVGGKNCNHGGAVSEAVKAAKDAAKAERDAARAAERDAKKAERDAKKAERDAARAERKASQRGGGHGKGHGH